VYVLNLVVNWNPQRAVLVLDDEAPIRVALRGLGLLLDSAEACARTLTERLRGGRR
jgi:hypothetical protein